MINNEKNKSNPIDNHKININNDGDNYKNNNNNIFINTEFYLNNYINQLLYLIVRNRLVINPQNLNIIPIIGMVIVFLEVFLGLFTGLKIYMLE